MRRVLAGALAVAAMHSSALAQDPTNADIAWAGGIDTQGWALVASGAAGETVVYARKPQRLSPNLVRMWSRFETRRATPRSGVQLVEYDCAGNRERLIQATEYPSNGMQGSSTSPEPSGKWSYPIPGTVAEILKDQACEP